METNPPNSHESTPPEPEADEPLTPVPTNETTPVWAGTVPVEPATNSDEAAPTDAVEEALPPLPMQKGDPDWSKTDPSANGEGKKTTPTPEWAQTVQTEPGDPIPEATEAGAYEEATAAPAPEAKVPPEPKITPPPAAEAVAPPAPKAARPAPEKPAEPVVEAPLAEPVVEAPLTEPLKAVASDAKKSTWPPAAESAPAPAEETDIWPPEPPTERAMPAWRPLSELEEPATPAQAIPSWPDSFDAEPAPAIPPTMTPAPETIPLPKIAAPPPAPAVPAAAAAPAAPQPAPPSPAKPAATPPAQPESAAPAGSGPASRPSWAPGPPPPAPAAPKGDATTPIKVPAWAPRVPLAGEPGTPTWFSPKEAIPHATGQGIVQPTPEPAPQPPAAPPPGGGHLPVAQVPAAQAHPDPTKSSWEVVEQRSKSGPHKKAQGGVTAEDRSYAEWFAWAKRGGAPASACHAAAQGAFKALSSGKDVMTAVQWATAAMSRPPENVSYDRQTYCAWFSLAHLDLNLDQHRAHLFAGGAVQALDAGQDASAAHAAGLAAAGIR